MQGSTFLSCIFISEYIVYHGFKNTFVDHNVLRLVIWRSHGEQIGEEFPTSKKLPGERNLDQMPLSLDCKLTLGPHVI